MSALRVLISNCELSGIDMCLGILQIWVAAVTVLISVKLSLLKLLDTRNASMPALEFDLQMDLT